MQEMGGQERCGASSAMHPAGSFSSLVFLLHHILLLHLYTSSYTVTVLLLFLPTLSPLPLIPIPLPLNPCLFLLLLFLQTCVSSLFYPLSLNPCLFLLFLLNICYPPLHFLRFKISLLFYSISYFPPPPSSF